MQRKIKINESKLLTIVNNCVKDFIKENSNFKYPNKFYHATISKNLKSIKKYGLGGKIPKARFWDYEGTIYEKIKQGVFLTNDPYIASDFIETSDYFDSDDDIDIVVFEIDIKDIDIDKLNDDYNMNTDEAFTWFYNGVIPYNKLKIVQL